jgi:urease accessory protein UreF
MVDSSNGLGVLIEDLPNKGVVISGNVFNKWLKTPIDNQATDTSGITLMDNWVERPASEYTDASRSVDAYAMAQGFSGIDALIAEADKQTKARWRVELSGTAISDYIAKGFARP